MKAIRKIECHHVLDGPVMRPSHILQGTWTWRADMPTNKEPEQQPNIFQTLFLFGGPQKKCIHSFVFRNSKKPAPTLWFVNHD